MSLIIFSIRWCFNFGDGLKTITNNVYFKRHFDFKKVGVSFLCERSKYSRGKLVVWLCVQLFPSLVMVKRLYNYLNREGQ